MGDYERSISSTSAAAIVQNDQTRMALEMRKAGLTLQEIGDQIGLNPETVRRKLRQAMTLNIRDLVEAVRIQELETLERLEKKADELVDTTYLKVSAGRVVMMGLRDDQGNPIIDARTNLPAEVAMIDKEPVNAAIATRLRIMERKTKLLGMDRAPKPDTSAPIDPTQDITPAQMEIAMERWLEQMNGKRRAAQAEDAVVVSSSLADDPILRQE